MFTNSSIFFIIKGIHQYASEAIAVKGSIYFKIKEGMNYENEKSISKNQTCKDLELSRGNFNRYCRDEIQRIDKNLILKLCEYLDCDIVDILEIIEL